MSDDSDAPQYAREAIADFEEYLKSLDPGRLRQTLDALKKDPLFELERDPNVGLYTSSPIQYVAYVMRGRVPGAFEAALATGCYAEALAHVFVGGPITLDPPTDNFDAGAFDLLSKDEKAVTINVGIDNTLHARQFGWPEGDVFDLDALRARGFTVRKPRHGDLDPAGLLRAYPGLDRLIIKAPQDPLPLGERVLDLVLDESERRLFDRLEWKVSPAPAPAAQTSRRKTRTSRRRPRPHPCHHHRPTRGDGGRGG